MDRSIQELIFGDNEKIESNVYSWQTNTAASLLSGVLILIFTLLYLPDISTRSLSQVAMASIWKFLVLSDIGQLYHFPQSQVVFPGYLGRYKYDAAPSPEILFIC